MCTRTGMKYESKVSQLFNNPFLHLQSHYCSFIMIHYIFHYDFGYGIVLFLQYTFNS